ncbi:MAG: DUF3365 domain-containing protein [Magnetococcales bacterium]|nr:DUF3365 domain-containing protein [Magnetococcales bacterium]
MNWTREAGRAPRMIQSYSAIVLAGWTLIVLFSLFWSLHTSWDNHLNLAKVEATIHLNKDLAFRKWATSHGGVYVTPSEETPPNPYLAHVPARDVVTDRGQRLTLMNPAYVLRQVMERYSQEYGVRGHITSLHLLNPLNAPDDWERRALESFAQGLKEKMELTVLDGGSHLRYMRPMIMEKGCLKCHAATGIAEGGVRGGISVAIPMASYEVGFRQSRLNSLWSHGLFWLAGVAGIGFIRRQSLNHVRERAEASEALKEREARFKSLFYDSPISLWEEDFSAVKEYLEMRGRTSGPVSLEMAAECARLTRVASVNEATLQILGANSATHLLSELGQLFTPASLKIFAEELSAFLAGQLRFSADSPLRTMDGREIWVHLSVSLAPGYEATWGKLFVSMVDITRRREAEAALAASEGRFRTLFHDAADGILMAEAPSGRFVGANPAICTMLDYTETELLGLEVNRIHPPADLTWVRDLFLSMGRGDIHMARDVPVVRRDGSLFHADISSFNMRSGEQNVVVGAFRDVSERRRLLLEVERAKEAAEAASHAKTAFLANISHEIRTPLHSVIGMAELLQETELNDEQRRYVHVFRKAGDNLLNVINDVLDISRIESGRMELEHLPFQPRELLEEACDIAARAAESKGLELICRIDPALDGRWSGDATRIRQIAANLLGNAIKFTAVGEVRLTARAVEIRGGPGMLLQVIDSGIGIEPEKQAGIFDLFSQADASTTRRFGGSGLGLAICRRLAELMGGEIRVESQLGRGSRFSVTLTLTPLSEEASLLSPSARFGFPPRDDPPPPLRVLIAISGEAQREVARELLQTAGAESEAVGDPEEATRRVESARQVGAPWHAVLLDDPAWLEQLPPLEEKIILLRNARQVLLERERRTLQGVFHTLVKPVKRGDLLAALSRLRQIVVGGSETVPAVEVIPPSSSLAEDPPLHVLLVDDAEDNRLLVQTFLAKTPWRVTIVENGALAVAAVTAGTEEAPAFDVILMDVQMPVMDGLEATRRIRQWERENHRPPLPILALTADAFSEHVERSLRAGCSDHISKPIRKAMLLEIIRHWHPRREG